nr:retrotransposon-related protein [Ipomoea batatas]
MSTFDGTSPLDWVFQVEKYFNYYDIPEEQKLDVASFYMVAQALSWYQWMHKNQQLSSWRTFTVALEQRFGPSLYVNHCAALFKLTQKTTVAAYQYEFETVSNRVSDFHPDALFDCFISGLKPMIQHELAVLRPATLSDAIALAKLVEDKLRDSRALSPKSVSWRHHGSHRCQTKPFLLLLADDPTDTAEGGEHIEICEATDEVTQEGGITELAPKISLHALEGTVGPRTFRLTASVKGREFTVLIDTGSSHNYIQPRLAHYLHLVVDNTIHFPVAVGNGERIQSEGTCTTVPFTMQGAEFEADFHVLEFSGADAILGVHWLEVLGRIITDHKHLTMEFDYKGKSVRLVGTVSPNITLISCHQLTRLNHTNAIAEYLLLAPKSTCPEQTTVEQIKHPAIEELLNKFPDIFATPKDLPPSRNLDHHITLLPQSQPVNVKPYRYPHFQKDEIEKLVREMLQAQIIQPSTSLFSSAVLLVRKKDGT